MNGLATQCSAMLCLLLDIHSSLQNVVILLVILERKKGACHSFVCSSAVAAVAAERAVTVSENPLSVKSIVLSMSHRKLFCCKYILFINVS